MKKVIVLFLSLFCVSAFASPKREISFLFGPSITQTGNIQDLGDPNFNTAFQFDWFLQERHGIGIFLGNEFDFEGTSKQPLIKDASVHTFALHYAYRYRPQDSKFQFSINPGFGMQTIYDESYDYYWGYGYDDLSTAWAFTLKVMVDYILSDSVGSEGNTFFIGLGLNEIYSINDELRGRDVSGGRLSALFRIGFGF